PGSCAATVRGAPEPDRRPSSVYLAAGPCPAGRGHGALRSGIRVRPGPTHRARRPARREPHRRRSVPRPCGGTLLAPRAGMRGSRPAPATPEFEATSRTPVPAAGASSADAAWRLVEEGFDLAREHEIESLFTISNGYIGVRGSLAEGSAFSAPAAFIAGIFGRRPAPDAMPERVAAPDPLRLRIAVEGEELRLDRGKALEHRRVFDLKRGLLWREWRHRTPAGRVTRIRELRLASLADRHLLLQALELEPVNYSGRIEVVAWIERPESAAPHASPLPALRPVPPDPADEGDHTPPRLALRAEGSGAVVAYAVKSELRPADGPGVAPKVETRPGRVAERWTFTTRLGSRHRLTRVVAVRTSRDAVERAEAAAAHLARTGPGDAGRIVREHVEAWRERWRAADVEVDGDPSAQRALRFACHHLIGAANPDDERVSISARLLTG